MSLNALTGRRVFQTIGSMYRVCLAYRSLNALTGRRVFQTWMTTSLTVPASRVLMPLRAGGSFRRVAST